MKNVTYDAAVTCLDSIDVYGQEITSYQGSHLATQRLEASEERNRSCIGFL